ncbi:MAG: outer membrane protein assembly factor BamD [Ferruginibacter sp.]|nr:outer membrane protein assembly factor BamD [Cytophagales bacterium]
MRKLTSLRFLLFLAASFLFSCSSFQELRKNGTVEEKYQAAIGYYEKKDFYKAGMLLEEITPLIKGSQEAEKAQFYYAYCQYNQEMYQLAQFQFKRFYETFGRSEYAEEAQYMYAYSLFRDSPNHNLDQSSTFTALEALQTFVNTYPKSKYRDQSQQIIGDLRIKLETKAYENAKLYYRIGSSNVVYYKSAVIAFENFQKNFPDSGYNEELAYLKIVAEYELAKTSVDSRKKERFAEAVKFYEGFIDRYPTSKYLKDAERVYDNCVSEIGQPTTRNTGQ